MRNNWIGVCLVCTAAAVAMPMLFASETTHTSSAKAQQIEIKCEISSTDAEGNPEVIAAPTVIANAGRPATIIMTDTNGRTFKVKLTGRLIQDLKTDEAD